MAHELQERYSSLMDERLRKELVTKDSGTVKIFNTKYEGNPRAGAVKVPVRGEANIRNYDKASGIAPEETSTSYITISDFKDVAVNEIIDGYDAAAVPDNVVADRLDAAGYAGALELDSAGIKTLEQEGTKLTVKGTKAYDQVLEARTALSEKDVPLTGRYLIVSPSFYAEILKDENFIKQGDLSQKIVEQGVVGMISGFYVFESNNLSTTPNKTQFIAGHSNWCHRVREWAVPPYIADLKNDSKYIGASAVQGRWIHAHKVSKPEAVQVYQVTTV